MTETSCHIWATPAVSQSREPMACGGAGLEHLESPRAGGEYSITGPASNSVASLSAAAKITITEMVIESQRFGQRLLIDEEKLKEADSRKPLTVFDRADNLLRYLEQKSGLIGQVLRFNALNNADQKRIEYELLAWTSSQKMSEVVTLVEYCAERTWIQCKEASLRHEDVRYEIMLRPPGYARLSELDGTNKDSMKAFVAMWFSEEMKDAYSDGLKKGIEEAGYEPVRIDAIEHIDKIDDRIIAEIRKARFVVADFTSEKDKPRGGVYYEAGFAYGLNIPVIFTCRKDRLDGVHFDTRQFNHIVWEKPDDLSEQLKTRIEAVIGVGPLAQLD